MNHEHDNTPHKLSHQTSGTATNHTCTTSRNQAPPHTQSLCASDSAVQYRPRQPMHARSSERLGIQGYVCLTHPSRAGLQRDQVPCPPLPSTHPRGLWGTSVVQTLTLAQLVWHHIGVGSLPWYIDKPLGEATRSALAPPQSTARP